jgi:iron complex outermembrane recepter protein
VRNGNIGVRQNMGVAVSAQIPVRKWWTFIWYGNYTYNKFTGILYGSDINISSPTVLININNQFKFNHGWGAELSGFYRSKGVEGQILLQPFGQTSAAISKQILNEKGSLKLGIRDALRTQIVKGTIDFQQTDASFKNSRDSRQVSLTFTYRFGKPIKGVQPHRNTGCANDESNRVKTGGNN